MSKNYSTLLIPTNTLPEDLVETLETMDTLCNQYESAEKKQEILEKLHSTYWQTVIRIIPTLITRETKEAFTIPSAYYHWLDFGCVSPDLCPEYKRATDVREDIPAEWRSIYDEYEVLYLHEWLERVHAKNIRLGKKERTQEQLVRAQEALDNYPRDLQQCIEARNSFIRHHPRASNIVPISREIEERLPLYNEITEKIERSIQLTKEERIRYVELNDELNDLRELRTREQQAIADKMPLYEMMELDKRVEDMIFYKRLLRHELEKAMAEAAEDEQWRNGVPLSQCHELMKMELRRIRSMSELIGRRSRIKQCAILTGSERVPTPLQIIKAIEEVLEIDSTLFTGRDRRKGRFPLIIVIPGTGDGVYDFENYALLIPTRPVRGLLRAVATALIEFHLDSLSGDRFRETYLRLKKNRHLVSTLQLRESLLRDYIEWVTLEAKGYQVLDKETRNWFFENIAPALFALRHPRRLGDLSIAEAHDFIRANEERLNVGTGEYDLEFKMGVMYWRIGEYSKANVAFVKAVELQPDSVEGCYNVALSFFRLGHKAKAAEWWRTYLRLDRASFWQVRVQKFLSSMQY